MNWTAHPNLYQLTHWWHWLGYGQNASVMGVLGLIAYVFYTRRMMIAAEETRRLSLTPYLLAGTGESGQSSLIVTNAAAAAVRCEVWMQITDPGTRLGMRFKRPEGIKQVFVPLISAGKTYVMTMVLPPDDSDIIYVIDCFDTAGGSYQLQVLQKALGNGAFAIESAFSVPDTFNPIWKRALNRVRQWFMLRKLRHGVRERQSNNSRSV